MSHWFHRSILKATTLVDYNDVFFGSFNFTKLASDLRRVRDRLLDLLPDSSHGTETIDSAFIAYLSLMTGFLVDFKVFGKKVRYLFKYRWTHSLLGQTPQVQQDAVFDMANMSINVALWHMKHASFIASKKIICMDDAKNVHTSLRKAAGIFEMVLRDLIPILEPGSSGSDLDPRVLNAYCTQCTAEAQEVTLARSIQLQHNDQLISSLANETSILFEKAKNYLKELDKNVSEQWSFYLDVKKHIYLAFAYCYSGKHLLKENHCGEAIRNLKEGQIYYEKALRLCNSYSKVKGPTKPVKPDGHTFFTDINSTLGLLLEKCEKENDFIFHQKVPDNLVSLEKKEVYGLVTPEHYILPQPLPLWEAAFENENLIPKEEKRRESTIKTLFRRERDLPAVKEIVHFDETDGTIADNGCNIQ